MGTRLKALRTFLFGEPKAKPNNLKYAPTMSGYSPIWSDFGDNIYASDIIVQAIQCKTTEFKKLKPRHIRIVDGKQVVVTDSSIAKLLVRPNDWMTISDFLEKVETLLELNKNVFIYPDYYYTKGKEKVYRGLYILRPNLVEYLQDSNGKLYIKFEFSNNYTSEGYTYTLPVTDVIHLRKNYGVDEYFGGGIYGNDQQGLLKLLKEYDKLTQSIAEGLNISTKINGIVKYNSYLDDEEVKAKQEEFNQRLLSGDSGVFFTDNKTEFVNIPRDVKLVDANTMNYFYDAILRNTGVSRAILNGDYTKAQKEAFYEHALEGDIIAIGQAMTKVIFSDRELSYGNEIVFYPNNIVFMSMENKLSALQIGLPAGIFVKDEARELLGYPPLPNGQGQVIAQGYNSLLDENNQNKLATEGGANNVTESE